MIFPLLPVFVASLGAPMVFIGLVEGLADATSSVLKLVFGELSDRVASKKPLVLLGYALAAVVRPLVALATAPWHVLAIRVVDRVGKGVRSAPRDALLASSVGSADAGRAFGFHRAMDHAGAVVGPLVATVLLGLHVPLRTIFAIAIVPGLLSVASVFLIREPDAAVATREPEVASTSLPARLKSYLAILFLFSLGNSSDAFLLLRARDLGVEVEHLPLLWMVFHVVKLASSYVGGGWADRQPRTRLVLAGWLVYALTYVAFGFATSAREAWALFLVYGVYYGLTEPAEKALVKDLAPAALRGRAYGAYNFLVGIAAVPAGLLTGFVWQTVSPSVALFVGASLALVASIGLVGWSRGSR